MDEFRAGVTIGVLFFGLALLYSEVIGPALSNVGNKGGAQG